MRPPYNFRVDKRFQALWTTLTEDKITSHDEWWARYVEHVKRRNGVVHRGQHVDLDSAMESVQRLPD